MQRFKNVVFTLLPAAILFAVIEGGAQLYWRYRTSQAIDAQMKNNAINFLNEPDKVLVYRLKSNLRGGTATNSRGLAQAEEVEYDRAPYSLRVLSVGESTTYGTNSLTANYPSQLRSILRSVANGYTGGMEVINAGVPGWFSDQWTLYSEQELHRYRPDVVILYAGWNDFQAYDPYAPAPTTSFFSLYYGSSGPSVTGLKSVVLLRALFDKALDEARRKPPQRLTGAWKPEAGASLGESTASGPLRAVLPPNGEISLLLPAHFLSSRAAEYILDFKLRGSGSVSVTARAYGNGSVYGNCTVAVAPEWSSSSCRFVKPEGKNDAQIGIAAAGASTVTELEISDLSVRRVRLLRGPKVVAEWASRHVREPPEATYRFFLENLTRTIEAYRRANPEVRIAIASLVGRWPMDTDEQFRRRDGHIGWMEYRGISRKEAPELLHEFNSLIAKYARHKGLFFVDMARTFEGLDRQLLMWDFAHMTEDGYRIMAHVFYQDLRRAGIIRGRENLQMRLLLEQYRVKASKGA